MTRILLLGLCCVFFAVQTLPAQVTSQMHYQGVLKDASDQLVEGSQNLTFRLYDVASGGTALWTESQTLAVIEGSFSAVLGSVTPLANVAFNRSYWLGVSVNGQTEMTPRVALIPVPYSLNTRSIPDRVVTSGKIAAGTVVRSVNGLRDSVTLEGRGNVAVTKEGNKVVISSTAASGTANNGAAGVQSINALTGSVALVAGSSNVTITQDTTGIAKQIVIAVTASSPINNTGNTISGLHSTVGGGNENTVTDNYGTVAGGRQNKAGNDTTAFNDRTYATVSGGGENTASGAYATVSGGKQNVASGSQSTVPGGEKNIAAGNHSLAAGYRSQVRAQDSGTFVWADNENADFISTGAKQFLIRAGNGVGINTPQPAVDAALTVEGDIVIRAGGTIRYEGNGTDASFGTIGGPTTSTSVSPGNTVTGNYGTVGGGENNQAGNDDGNIGSAQWATVGGGRNNKASGTGATIPGGTNNTASGNYSFAAGRNAHADFGGSFVWSSDFGLTNSTARHATKGNQFLIFSEGGVGIGTNVTPDGVALNVDGTIVATKVIQGGGNTVDGFRATIGGGRNNSTFDNYSTVSGGRGNTSGTNDTDNQSSWYATVSGGFQNNAGAISATVSGGEGNTVGANYGTVSGGRDNSVNGNVSVISGGRGNQVLSGVSAGTIGGGGGAGNSNNTVSDNAGTVGGGQGNRAGDTDTDVTTSTHATVGGGENNVASATGSTVPGGGENLASGDYSVVAGGLQNAATGNYSFAVGRRAKAIHHGTFVWADNRDQDFESTDQGQFLIGARNGVGINIANPQSALHVVGKISTTGNNGGIAFPDGTTQTTAFVRDASNTVGGNFSTISGGQGNTIDADANLGTISGGQDNRVRGNASVIGGGLKNVIRPNVNLAFIGGGGGPNDGMENIVKDRWGVVVGGRNNQAGDDNTDVTTSMYATVGGGANNTASGQASTVSGGQGNQASGEYSFVSGGQGNQASGEYSFVSGGQGNQASGNYSFAAGRRAKANHHGTFVWADNRDQNFASTAQRQFLIDAANGVGVGTNAPGGQMTIKGQREISGDGQANPKNVVLDLQIDKWQVNADFSDVFIAFYATNQNDNSRQYQGGIRGKNGGDGVSLHSPTGDFAEYLKRMNPDEILNPGDIVGVFGGKISRKTDGAHHLMVITDRAIVSGNAPPEGEEHLWEEVAFIGQVPVKVVGQIKAGDYILVSGKGDGVGVAVSPDKMKPEDYARIVGRAWGSSNEMGVKRVNAVVGLAMNQMGRPDVQQAEMRSLKEENAKQQAEMQSLKKENADLLNRLTTLEQLVQKIAREASRETQTVSLDR